MNGTLSVMPALLASAFLPWAGAAQEREPIVGLPCEGCEAVFEGMPRDIPSVARIASATEPGEPMVIEGTVREADGSLVPGIILYAYHTNAVGVYPKDETLRGTTAYRHGRLRAWVRTDSAGGYRFETVRPAPYPGSRTAEHVHMHVIEPGRCTYYIASINFDDDPLLTAEEREGQERGRGGSGLVSPGRDAKGRWMVRRDIVLGLRVPEYAQCGR